MTETEVIASIKRDHGATVTRDSVLKKYLKTIRTTQLTCEQLSEFYMVRVQQQKNTGMQGRTLHKWFETTMSMVCCRSTFGCWEADIPSAAMIDSSIPTDCLGDAAFADCEATVWDVFITNPFAEAPAIAQLLEPRIGKVHIPMLETWLDRTRSTRLDLGAWSPSTKSWCTKDFYVFEVGMEH